MLWNLVLLSPRLHSLEYYCPQDCWCEISSCWAPGCTPCVYKRCPRLCNRRILTSEPQAVSTVARTVPRTINWRLRKILSLRPCQLWLRLNPGNRYCLICLDVCLEVNSCYQFYYRWKYICKLSSTLDGMSSLVKLSLIVLMSDLCVSVPCYIRQEERKQDWRPL